MTSWMRRLLRGEAGFTTVEMIITIVVGGLVMAAVFPIFLLVSRVERTFSASAQARAVGIIAEQTIGQDLRTYAVVRTGPQTLVGMDGEVRESGLVFVDGELWHAHAGDGTQLLAGEHVQVDALNGLELTVTPKR